MLNGDLGYSIQHRTEVSKLLRERFPWTLFLTLTALLLSFGTALILGTSRGAQARAHWSVLVPAVVLESVPPFVLGSLLMVLLSVHARLFPLGGGYSPFSGFAGGRQLVDLLHHAALPVLVLAASSFFSFYLVVRSSPSLVKNEPYVSMAALKGLPERAIRYRYVLRTALLPVVAFFGMRLAYSAGGAILVEVVFAYPGIGRLTYEAVLAHDYALLQGCFMTFTLWVLSINFLTDCLYVSLDPRVKEA
jgi:peptide/nickel transport system permease protein